MYGERKLITHCSSEIDIAVPGSCHASSLWIDPPTMLIWNRQIVAASSSGVAEVAASIARGLVFGQISLNRLTRSVFIGSHKFYFMLDNIDYRDCPTDPGSGGMDSLSRGYDWGLLLSAAPAANTILLTLQIISDTSSPLHIQVGSNSKSEERYSNNKLSQFRRQTWHLWIAGYAM